MSRATARWPKARRGLPVPRRPRSARVGDYDVPVDPALPGDRVDPIWLPRHNPRLAWLTPVDAALADGPALPPLGPEPPVATADGRYGHLVGLPPANQALIEGAASTTVPVALVLPLDTLFEDRVEAARRLRRALVRGARVKPYGITPHRRRRLKLVLRALDGYLAGEDYRAIARGLFGARVPNDATWRTHSLRSFTVRLVREGRALMRGGYLALLRPDRRKR